MRGWNLVGGLEVPLGVAMRSERYAGDGGGYSETRPIEVIRWVSLLAAPVPLPTALSVGATRPEPQTVVIARPPRGPPPAGVLADNAASSRQSPASSA